MFSGTGLTREQREMQDWVRRLFNWRKHTAVIHDGALMQYAPLQDCYVYFRYDAGHTVLVALNKGGQPVELPTARFPERLQAGDRAHDVLSGRDFAIGTTLSLPARGALILEIRR